LVALADHGRRAVEDDLALRVVPVGGAAFGLHVAFPVGDVLRAAGGDAHDVGAGRGARVHAVGFGLVDVADAVVGGDDLGGVGEVGVDRAERGADVVFLRVVGGRVVGGDPVAFLGDEAGLVLLGVGVDVVPVGDGFLVQRPVAEPAADAQGGDGDGDEDEG